MWDSEEGGYACAPCSWISDCQWASEKSSPGAEQHSWETCCCSSKAYSHDVYHNAPDEQVWFSVCGLHSQHMSLRLSGRFTIVQIISPPHRVTEVRSSGHCFFAPVWTTLCDWYDCIGTLPSLCISVVYTYVQEGSRSKQKRTACIWVGPDCPWVTSWKWRLQTAVVHCDSLNIYYIL